MRRHRVFLLCTVGLCVISFLHYYKALHYVSLLRELSAPYPNIKSFIMVTGFFWKEKGLAATPLSPASPEEAPPLPVLRPSDTKARAVGGGEGEMGMGVGRGGQEMGPREEPAPPHPWEKPVEHEQLNSLDEVRRVHVYLKTRTYMCLFQFIETCFKMDETVFSPVIRKLVYCHSSNIPLTTSYLP